VASHRPVVEAPPAIHPDFGPWNSVPRLAILIPSGDRPTAEIIATVEDILLSTFQDYTVLISGRPAGGLEQLRIWLRDDRRFAVATRTAREIPAAKFVVVLPAGWRLTRYSLEALLSAVQLPGVAVVRVLVEGHSRPVEIWHREYLVGSGPKNATRAARTNGAERWIDGSSLGLYAHGCVAPKVFFRKGPADRHILEFVVYDSRKEAFKQSQRRRIEALERDIRGLRSQINLDGSRGNARKSIRTLRRLRTVVRAQVGGLKRMVWGGTR
jgi:hypothetical protein